MNLEAPGPPPSIEHAGSAGPVQGNGIATEDPGSGLHWTAVVLAGQRPGLDPVAVRFGHRLKATIPILEQPMMSYVLRALLATPGVGRIIVVSQADELVEGLCRTYGDDRVAWLPGASGISGSLMAAIASLAEPWPVLVTTADHPLLTPALLSTFMGEAGGDLSIGVVERDVVLATFPDSRRTWLRFRDGAFTGANLFAFRRPASLAALRFWAEAERDRKRPWRLFRRFGPVLAFRAMTRTIGLHEAVAAAGRRLGISAGLVELGRAEAGVDVDSPEDHALAERLIGARAPT